MKHFFMSTSMIIAVNYARKHSRKSFSRRMREFAENVNLRDIIQV